MKETRNSARKRRIIIPVAILLMVVVLAVPIGIGNFLVTYAIGRSGDGGNRQVALQVNRDAMTKTDELRMKNNEIQQKLTQAFQEQVSEETVSIQSADGLTLKGGFYNREDSHQWAIVIHGYRSNHHHMVNYAQRYYDAGYRVLAPDLRACGESEGDFVGMGWADRLDLPLWIQWILKKDPEAKIVMHGISMGGATVMMTSGQGLPESVVAFVEDCGYTSVWDIFSSELGLRFHLPTFPILNAASGIATLRAGYDFSEASSVAEVSKCTRPMMFIHGDQDDFVPFDMLQKVYDAKPGENKKMLVAEGAGHGLASSVLGQEYWDEVFAFLREYGMEN